MSWSRRHLLDIDGFSAADLDLVLREAARRAPARSTPAAVGSPAAWRPRGAAVCRELDAHTPVVRARRTSAGRADLHARPVSSSMTKGETFVDTVRNLDASASTTSSSATTARAPWVAARHFGGHVVNAGDGWHAHPDAGAARRADARRRVRRSWRRLRGRKIAIVGDILHSRVARSNLTRWPSPALTSGSARRRAGCAAWMGSGSTDERSRRRPRGCRRGDGPARAEGAHAPASCQLGEYVERYQITEERLGAARAAGDLHASGASQRGHRGYPRGRARPALVGPRAGPQRRAHADGRAGHHRCRWR